MLHYISSWITLCPWLHKNVMRTATCICLYWYIKQ